MTKRMSRHGEKRSARLDLRITPTDRAFIEAYAKRNYRTIASLMEEWLDWVALQEVAK